MLRPQHLEENIFGNASCPLSFALPGILGGCERKTKYIFYESKKYFINMM